MNNLKEQYEINKDLVTLRESVKYPGLFVLKYKKKVFYENLWNDFLEEARGLVVDKDFNIVSRPFKKIYNYGVEKRAPKFSDNEFVFAYDKINGFMVAATFYNGQLIVSTTGSLDSGFVELGRQWIESNQKLMDYISARPTLTFLFECCDPSDPHIIAQKSGLYLLGMRHKDDGDLIPMGELGKFIDINAVNLQYIQFADLKNKSKIVKHEGFVIYSNDLERVSKIKSSYYLTKKFLMRKNIDKILSTDAKELMDEEFYPLLDYIKEVDKDLFFSLDELAKREYIEKWFTK